MTASLVNSYRTAKPQLRTIFVVLGGDAVRPSGFAWAVLGLMAHMAIAPFLVQSPGLTEIYAFSVVGYGLFVAVTGTQVGRTAPVAAYICGTEVLWRMSHAALFWELGKYSIIMLFLIEIWKRKSRPLFYWPLFYFLLLLPSTVLTLAHLDLGRAHKEISFNLSGPLLLFVAVSYFRGARLTEAAFQRVAWSYVMPAAGIASIAIAKILRTSDIQFTDDSNPVLSGGYGPNQVSAVLALGAYLLFLVLAYRQWSFRFQALFGLTLCLLAAQSAMTFSRGGLYAAGGAAVVAAILLWPDAPIRRRILNWLAILAVASVTVIGPGINSFTGGALSKRFSDTNLTHRQELSETDLDSWRQHPLMGIGPGMSREVHYGGLAAHTEFSRMLAEHGTLGFLSLLILLATGFVRASSTPNLRTRSLAVSAMIWSLLFMSANAMRIAAPSFLFGIAFLDLQQSLSGSYLLYRPRKALVREVS